MPCESPKLLRLDMRRWAFGAPGRWFQAEERAQLNEALETLFGYYLLLVGDVYPKNCLTGSKIPNRMVLDLEIDREVLRQHGHSGLYGQAEALPVATDCLDVVVLPHTLEFSEDPHQVLREADRILIPEGHVVILGFNPWSLWLLWRLALGWRGRPPWCGRFISQTRVRDWLALLGFEVVHSRQYFFRPPLSQKGIMRRLRFLDRVGRRWWPVLGAGYILVAKKRVIPLTPIRIPGHAPRRRLAAADLLGNSSGRGSSPLARKQGASGVK